MSYLNFTAADFVKDTLFQKWVLDPDDETNEFWLDWIQQHPHKRAEIEEAKEIIDALHLSADIEANQAFLEVWENINAEKEKNRSDDRFSAVPAVGTWLTHKQLAAVFIGLLVLSASLFFLFKTQQNPTVRYATQYGRTKTITLPDSSIVTLNANSSLLYAGGWDSGKPREVWLQGEAFFKVRKKQTTGNAKFKVHTEEMTVEVLGTQFNVNNRRNTTKVVLNEGKVKVNLQSGDERSLVMHPGDYVEYSKDDERIIKKKVDTSFYSSWVDNKLLFNKTALKDIAILVKDNYGLQFVFTDPALANKRFTGMVPADDIDLLLETIVKLYRVEIIKDNNRVTFITSDQRDSVAP